MARPAYPSVQSHYAAKMMRLALSVGVVWGVASTCLAILLVTVFLQVGCCSAAGGVYDAAGPVDGRHAPVQGPGQLRPLAVVLGQVRPRCRAA